MDGGGQIAADRQGRTAACVCGAVCMFPRSRIPQRTASETEQGASQGLPVSSIFADQRKGSTVEAEADASAFGCCGFVLSPPRGGLCAAPPCTLAEVFALSPVAKGDRIPELSVDLRRPALAPMMAGSEAIILCALARPSPTKVIDFVTPPPGPSLGRAVSPPLRCSPAETLASALPFAPVLCRPGSSRRRDDPVLCCAGASSAPPVPLGENTHGVIIPSPVVEARSGGFPTLFLEPGEGKTPFLPRSAGKKPMVSDGLGEGAAELLAPCNHSHCVSATTGGFHWRYCCRPPLVALTCPPDCLDAL